MLVVEVLGVGVWVVEVLGVDRWVVEVLGVGWWVVEVLGVGVLVVEVVGVQIKPDEHTWPNAYLQICQTSEISEILRETPVLFATLSAKLVIFSAVGIESEQLIVFLNMLIIF